MGAQRLWRSSEDVLPSPLVWQPWRPEACEMSPGPCPCPSLPPAIALDVGCFSLLKEELSWEEAPQEKGSPGLPFYPKMVETFSSGDVSQNESIWDGLWEGEIGLFVPSSVL